MHDVSSLGVFWDYACIPQKPRTMDEDAKFRAAIDVMGDLYASAVGTCVLRLEEIPDAALDTELEEDADAYNTRPYEHRGWCIFESEVSMLPMVYLSEYWSLKRKLEGRMERAKSYEISTQPPTTVQAMGAWSPENIESRIERGHFTSGADRQKVVDMYREYVVKMVDAARREASFVENLEMVVKALKFGLEERGYERASRGVSYPFYILVACCWPCAYGLFAFFRRTGWSMFVPKDQRADWSPPQHDIPMPHPSRDLRATPFAKKLLMDREHGRVDRTQ